jgi:hypothetical protein
MLTCPTLFPLPDLEHWNPDYDNPFWDFSNGDESESKKKKNTKRTCFINNIKFTLKWLDS